MPCIFTTTFDFLLDWLWEDLWKQADSQAVQERFILFSPACMRCHLLHILRVAMQHTLDEATVSLFLPFHWHLRHPHGHLCHWVDAH